MKLGCFPSIGARKEGGIARSDRARYWGVRSWVLIDADASSISSRRFRGIKTGVSQGRKSILSPTLSSRDSRKDSYLAGVNSELNLCRSSGITWTSLPHRQTLLRNRLEMRLLRKNEFGEYASRRRLHLSEGDHRNRSPQLVSGNPQTG